MDIIATFRNRDVIPNDAVVATSGFKRRETVRAVVGNQLGQVALLHVSNQSFHKLPGGGIKPGESLTEALDREVMEEIGCRIKILGKLGKVVEYRDEMQQIQVSFCYIAEQVGEQQENNLTDEERKAGYEIVWAKEIDDAIATLEADKPSKDGKRINPRDLIILKEARAFSN